MGRGMGDGMLQVACSFFFFFAAALLLAPQLQEAQGRELSASSLHDDQTEAMQLVVAADDGQQQRGNYACNYHFEVKTGDVDYAGTDSKITFTVYRQDGSGWWTVEDGIGTWHKQPFERGHLDTFDRNMWCMHPCKLTISSNGSGPYPDWYVEWVRVTVTGQMSDQKTFYLNDWIGPYSPRGYDATINYCNNGQNNHLSVSNNAAEAA